GDAGHVVPQDRCRQVLSSCARELEHILTLPPTWASAGGAPVSDPAVPAQDRAMLPDRRPALRWQCQVRNASGTSLSSGSATTRMPYYNAWRNRIAEAWTPRRVKLRDRKSVV